VTGQSDKAKLNRHLCWRRRSESPLRHMHWRADDRRRDYFDPSYSGNPLVTNLRWRLTARRHWERRGEGVGNRCFMSGAETGRDGLAGAAFASQRADLTKSRGYPAVHGWAKFHKRADLQFGISRRKSSTTGLERKSRQSSFSLASGRTVTECEANSIPSSLPPADRSWAAGWEGINGRPGDKRRLWA